ncbi:MAG: hypothetical protein J6I45_01355 [Clostridia bacterium]|nr:hypothetical protein [Clostridia bacterium]
MATVMKESGQGKSKLPESMSFSEFGGINRTKRAEKSGRVLEASDMVNFRVDAGGTLVKRSGYSKLCEVSGNIRGAWQGMVGGNELLLFATEQDFYRMKRGAASAEKIGALQESGTGKVDFFAYKGNVYVNDGSDFYICNGSTLSLVEGYTPLVKVHCSNYGVSSDYENENLLSRKVRVQLDIKSGVNVYRLPHEYVGEILSVTLNGRKLTPGTDYTIDASFVIYVYLELVTAPTENISNGCEMVYMLRDNGERKKLCRCRHSALLNGSELSAVMLYDGEDGRSVYVSKSDELGHARPDYFTEEDKFTMIAGAGNVTALIQQYETVMLFCERCVYSLRAENVNDGQGFRHTVFTPAIVNDELGCIAPGCAAQLENAPISLTADGVYRWVSTYVSGEKNAKKISERVGVLPAAGEDTMLYVSRADGELLVSFGDTIYVYNYLLDAWYRYEGFGAAGMFDCYGRAAFFSGGAVCLLDGSGDDAGEAIEARFEGLPFELTPVGAVKNLYRVIVSTLPPEGDVIDFSLLTDDGRSADFKLESSGQPTWARCRCRMKHVKSCSVSIGAAGTGGTAVSGFALQYGIGGDR